MTILSIGGSTFLLWEHIQMHRVRHTFSRRLISGSLPSDTSIGTTRTGVKRCLPTTCVSSTEAYLEKCLIRCGSKELVQCTPQPFIRLSEWTSYSSLLHKGNPPPTAMHVLLEATPSNHNKDVNVEYDQQGKLLLENVSQRIAWKSGETFSILVLCSPEQLEQILMAFFNDSLIAEDPVTFERIIVVSVDGRPEILACSPNMSRMSGKSLRGDCSPMSDVSFSGCMDEMVSFKGHKLGEAVSDPDFNDESRLSNSSGVQSRNLNSSSTNSDILSSTVQSSNIEESSSHSESKDSVSDLLNIFGPLSTTSGRSHKSQQSLTDFSSKSPLSTIEEASNTLQSPITSSSRVSPFDISNKLDNSNMEKSITPVSISDEISSNSPKLPESSVKSTAFTSSAFTEALQKPVDKPYCVNTHSESGSCFEQLSPNYTSQKQSVLALEGNETNCSYKARPSFMNSKSVERLENYVIHGPVTSSLSLLKPSNKKGMESKSADEQITSSTLDTKSVERLEDCVIHGPVTSSLSLLKPSNKKGMESESVDEQITSSTLDTKRVERLEDCVIHGPVTSSLSLLKPSNKKGMESESAGEQITPPDVESDHLQKSSPFIVDNHFIDISPINLINNNSEGKVSHDVEYVMYQNSHVENTTESNDLSSEQLAKFPTSAKITPQILSANELVNVHVSPKSEFSEVNCTYESKVSPTAAVGFDESHLEKVNMPHERVTEIRMSAAKKITTFQISPFNDYLDSKLPLDKEALKSKPLVSDENTTIQFSCIDHELESKSSLVTECCDYRRLSTDNILDSPSLPVIDRQSELQVQFTEQVDTSHDLINIQDLRVHNLLFKDGIESQPVLSNKNVTSQDSSINDGRISNISPAIKSLEFRVSPTGGESEVLLTNKQTGNKDLEFQNLPVNTTIHSEISQVEKDIKRVISILQQDSDLSPVELLSVSNTQFNTESGDICIDQSVAPQNSVIVQVSPANQTVDDVVDTFYHSAEYQTELSVPPEITFTEHNIPFEREELTISPADEVVDALNTQAFDNHIEQPTLSEINSEQFRSSSVNEAVEYYINQVISPEVLFADQDIHISPLDKSLERSIICQDLPKHNIVDLPVSPVNGDDLDEHILFIEQEMCTTDDQTVRPNVSPANQPNSSQFSLDKIPTTFQVSPCILNKCSPNLFKETSFQCRNLSTASSGNFQKSPSHILQQSHNSTTTPSGNPPRSLKLTDVLIFANNTCDHSGLNRELEKRLVGSLDNNRYTVYSIYESNFKQNVWQDVTQLLCLIESHSDSGFWSESTLNKITDFMQIGGQVMQVSCEAEKPEGLVSPLLSRMLAMLSDGWVTGVGASMSIDDLQRWLDVKQYFCMSHSDSGGVFVYIQESSLKTNSQLLPEVLSRLQLDLALPVKTSDSDDTQASPIYLFQDKQSDAEGTQLLDTIFPDDKLSRLSGVHLAPDTGDDADDHGNSNNNSQSPPTSTAGLSEKTVPLYVASRVASRPHFDDEDFFRCLRTSTLGRRLLHADVMASSFTHLDRLTPFLPSNSGLVVVSNIQTSGVGRSKNKWISPVGQAMFSYHVSVSLNSRLGQHISLIQHLAALSIVLTCWDLAGEEAADICVKWPNDVHLRGLGKLAGVLVKSTVVRNEIHLAIGCGINVANPLPTVCLHQVLSSKPSIAAVIAGCLNNMERLFDELEVGGVDQILDLYVKHWIHSDQRVEVIGSRDLSARRKPGRVVGVDKYGFLVVEMANGFRESIHPDGNSFDMMKNLVLPKN